MSSHAFSQIYLHVTFHTKDNRPMIRGEVESRLHDYLRTRAPEAVKTFNGRDALPRVHNRKPNPDAGHRVPTGSGSCGKRNFSQLPGKPRCGGARHWGHRGSRPPRCEDSTNPFD